MSEWKDTELGLIPSHWEVKTIDEIKAVKKGSIAMGPFGSNITTDNFVEAGVPVIRGNNLNDFIFGDSEFVFLTEEKADSLKNSICYSGDIVFTHRGTIGQVGIIPKDANYKRYVVSQSGMKLTINSDIISPEFIHLFFKSRVGQYILLRNKSQVGVPAIGQPTTSLKEMVVPIPPKGESDEIVKTILGIQNKITLLCVQNQTLEELAQTLFKRWFVEFEFPDENGNPYKSSGGKMVDSALGEIPEGWRIKPLSKIADFLNGLACQKFPVVKGLEKLPVLKIKELGNGINENTDWVTSEVDQKFIIENGDIIFSWSGTLMLKIWNGETCVLNQHLFKVTSELFSDWFIFQWTNFHLKHFTSVAKSKATTMGHIKRSHLDEAMCFVPIPTLLENLDGPFDSILKSYKNNNKEILSLTQLRDTLLPKLMSGELRVNF